MVQPAFGGPLLRHSYDSARASAWPLADPVGGELFLHRFELRRVLGEGAFGKVLEAFDLATGQHVALKFLTQSQPGAILRFKREFRALQDLRHRNLVELTELIAHSGQWILVMELIRGTTFLEHVLASARSPGQNGGGPLRFPEQRLRDALLQLTHGLSALHQSGRIHRDVKPFNVLVATSGRVVLLDFGLVTSDEENGSASQGDVVGTLIYMAPEQANGQVLTAAADWFSVGVLMYEALTGDAPFLGSPMQMLIAKHKGDFRPPQAVIPHLPPDLCALCTALLSPKPSERPGAEEIERVITRDARPRAGLSPRVNASVGAGLTTATPGLIGRDAELSILSNALLRSRKSFTAVVLHGEEGAGKTRLLQEVVRHETLANEASFALLSRCLESETVPYKALDGAIDRLCTLLRRLKPAEAVALLPANAGLLARLFPVFGEVARLNPRGRQARVGQDKLTSRGLAFTALRELFIQLGERGPLILAIDDAQWSDAESVALLSELIRAPNPPKMLLLISYRNAGDNDAHLRNILSLLEKAHPTHTRLTVAPLSLEHSTDLALTLLGTGDREQASRLAREAAGQPFLLEALVQHGGGGRGPRMSLDEAIADTLSKLPAYARKALDLICLAGGPVPRATLRDALAEETGELAPVLADLRRLNLVRAHRKGQVELLDAVHARLRDSIVASIGPRRRTEEHALLAGALERTVSVDRERVAYHLEQAGQFEKAARCATAAGDRAAEALAFDKACRMYEWARTLYRGHPDTREVTLKLAEALSKAGRWSLAADTYLEALAGASSAELLELQRRVAESLLQCGRVEEGLDMAEKLLARFGVSLPRTRGQALRTATWQALKHWVAGERFVAREPGASPYDALVATDLLWTLISTLGPVNPLLVAALQPQHFQRARASGDEGRFAIALSTDAFGRLFRGQHDRALTRAAEGLSHAERSGSPEALAFGHYMKAMVSGYLGDVGPELLGMDEAIRVFHEHGVGVCWLIDNVRMSLLSFLAEGGHWKRLLVEAEPIFAALDQRAESHLRAWAANAAAGPIMLARGEPEQALTVLTALPMEGALMHARSARVRYSVETYLGDGGAADRFLANVGDAETSGVLRLPWHCARWACLTSLLALTCDASPSGVARAKRHVEHQLKLLRPLPEALRTRSRALIEGTAARVAGHNEAAAVAFAACEQAAAGRDPLLEQVARVARGAVAPRAEGRLLIASVREELERAGVKAPLRFLHAMMPGSFSLETAEERGS